MGQLFIISGLSGSGKSFLVGKAMENLPYLHRVVTATTRLPRVDEVYGANYIYLSKDNFKRKIEQSFFVEWAHVYENYYGTPLVTFNLYMSIYRAVALVVDVQGAMTLKNQFPDAFSIFIDVEKVEIAAERIRLRGNYPGELRQRTAPTEVELKAAHHFDHRILNIDGYPEKAVDSICRIIGMYS